MSIALKQNTWIDKMARTGMIAKGIVYVILGNLAFMAAFEIGGTSDEDANSTGVFTSIKEAPAGIALLALLAAGLICYSVWRVIQSFTYDDDKKEKKWPKRARYLFSGLSYLALALTAIKLLMGNKKSGDKNQQIFSEIIDKPFGQWILISGAVVIAIIGIYQIWYGLAGKYKKHVQDLDSHSAKSTFLMRAGTIGYVARGIVWLILSFLLMRAALHTNAKEVGDTGKAFEFIESSTYGSFLLGGLGLGLICYGLFNFIRARYERL
ncbi:MAG: DUF1206 domain-containing protein [Flavisolibacter sp.]